MQLQESGWYDKSIFGYPRDKKFQWPYTSVHSFQESESCAQTRRQIYRKVPCKHVYLCGVTRWESTVIHVHNSLQSQ